MRDLEDIKIVDVRTRQTSDVRAGDIIWYNFGKKPDAPDYKLVRGCRPCLVLSTYCNKITIVPLSTREKYDVCDVTLANITNTGALSYPMWSDVQTVLTENITTGPWQITNTTGNIKDTYPDIWFKLVTYFADILLGNINYVTVTKNKSDELHAEQVRSEHQEKEIKDSANTLATQLANLTKVIDTPVPKETPAPIKPISNVEHLVYQAKHALVTEPSKVDFKKSKKKNNKKEKSTIKGALKPPKKRKRSLTDNSTVDDNKVEKTKIRKNVINVAGEEFLVDVLKDDKLTNKDRSELLNCSIPTIIRLKHMYNVPLNETRKKRTASAEQIIDMFGPHMIKSQLDLMDSNSFCSVYNCTKSTIDELRNIIDGIINTHTNGVNSSAYRKTK